MLINADAKALEFLTCLYLSRDPVGMQEYNSGLDVHEKNQSDLRLPTRTIAKVFLFRTIYCDEQQGGAWGFSHDPDFNHVSSSVKFWQGKIDAFYYKYNGIAKWHKELLRTVGSSGRLLMPWGRNYTFNRKPNNKGDLVWPKTMIYNYPVQGLGAELMAIVRVSLMRRMKQATLEAMLVSTVHDSVLVDAPENEVDQVCKLIFEVFRDVPKNFERLFKIKFDMELKVEIQKGNTWGEMALVTKESLL